MVFFAIYGIAMAAMWMDYEPRDKHIEFSSDFRESIEEFRPDITFENVTAARSYYDLPAAYYDLSVISVDDPWLFVHLTQPTKYPRERVIETIVEVKNDDQRKWILVKYLAPLPISKYVYEFSPYTYDNKLIPMFSHSETYDWPEGSDDWTATHLSYDGGDFHFDNKSGLWLATWLGIAMVFAVWVLISVKIAGWFK